METEQLRQLEIAEEDIDWVESVLKNGIHFDNARRNIIKNLESKDIQAFPGSGKTTVLVAKLAILAQKWFLTNSGICVLSHTNVAREEIAEKLGNTDVGKRLLSYPHFVGTFQSFFDTFVALPWLRSKGIQINVIDSELVQENRWNSLPRKTRSYLKRWNKDMRICCYQSKVGQINWDKGGKTRQHIIEAIEKSLQHGNFTFEEMLLYASQAIEACPQIAIGLQHRFPIIFIDEAQDTNALQWGLIHQAFPQEESLIICQGFGDTNQAIYNYVDEKVNHPEFPRPDQLLLAESRRFDNRIAQLANTVALSTTQMRGTGNEFTAKNCPHTIFLFSHSRAAQVIEAFGQLILDTFSDDELSKNEKYGCHVVGRVHVKKEDTKEEHFPKGIYDYWPTYDSRQSDKIQTPSKLIDYFRRGAQEFQMCRERSAQMEWLGKGIRRLINNAKNTNFIPATKNSFASILKQLPDESAQSLARQYFMNLAEIDTSNEEGWKQAQAILVDLLAAFDTSLNNNAKKFLKWAPPPAFNDLGKDGPTISNRYIFQDTNANRSVGLEFGSIHLVKGRTHLATLVLETYSKSHNIKAILRWLRGVPPKTVGTQADRLKCQYVAMTRAKGLLCIAIPIEFVDESSKKDLQRLGWSIRVID